MKKLSTIFSSFIFMIVLSATAWGQTLIDSFTDGDFTASPVWGGTTTKWTIVANSDAAAGATGSNTLRLNASAVSTTDYLTSQINTWGDSQEWGFWVGRRAQAFTAANQSYIWLYANESDVTSATVDGYRLAIGDDSGGDEVRLEYIVNGAVNATVITSSGSVTNAITDIGFLVRVTRSSSGGWALFTSTLPTATGSGAIASDVPNSTNANVSQGSATNNSLVPSSNGYIGVGALHSTGASAIIGVEFDQVYMTASFSTSNASDIIAYGSFTYPTNINYASNTGSDVTSSNPELFEFDIRDGGGAADGDANSTTLNAITFSVTNSSVLNKVALYDGTTELAEVAAGSTITFSGLTAAAADDASKTLNLRATYNTTVTDNTQFSFTVTSATADGAGSTFAAANAGGAVSSTSGDNNKIEVTASTLTFSSPSPSSPALNTNFSVTVSAKDANGNKDIDYGSNITLTTQSGTGNFSAASTTTHTASSGDASWTDLQYDVAESGVAIHASDGSLTGNSSTFSVVSSYSSNSDVTAIASSESATISSIENSASPLTSSQGAQVWQVTIRDGGGSADDDNLPTIVTALTLSQGGSNSVSSWSSAILAADLFDGSTHLASGTIGASSIAFSGFTATASDDGSKTLSVRISLKTSGLTDNQIFQFSLTNANTTTQSSATSSQMTGFSTINSSATDNKIAVVATKYVFSAQPSNTTVNTNFSATVQARDANENPDLDDASNVTMSASTGTITSTAGNPHALAAGVYAWTDLQNNTAGTGITLTASGTYTSAVSNSITVFDAQPSTQASALNFSSVGQTSMTVNWTNGNGAARIVVAKAAGTPTTPSDGSTYSANSVFGTG